MLTNFRPLYSTYICKYIHTYIQTYRAAQVALVVKNLLANAGDFKRRMFDPWVGKIPWRRVRQPTPVFMPGESHGRRSLVGMVYRVAESNTTEAT